MMSLMIISNVYLMIFAVAMMGCVLATPVVTWVATWVGAIDRPDQFRRIHQGCDPPVGWTCPGARRGGRDDPDTPQRLVEIASRRCVRISIWVVAAPRRARSSWSSVSSTTRGPWAPG